MSKRKNRIRGKKSKSYGDQFEKLIDMACKKYARQGKAYINKTYAPFTATRQKGNQVTGFYSATGQPDFSGTLKDGQSIVFEAKHTSTTNIRFDRIKKHQKHALNIHDSLGAESFIMIAFGLNDIYKVPIKDWIELEKTIDKKSVNEKDLADYKLGKYQGIQNFL